MGAPQDLGLPHFLDQVPLVSLEVFGDNVFFPNTLAPYSDYAKLDPARLICHRNEI